VRSFPSGARARRALTVAAWLACTTANVAVFADPGAAVDTDEIYWLGQTYYYHLAFRARDWHHPDWKLIPARENPPGAKYVLGAGVGMQGFPIASLDLLGSFYTYYEVHLGRHAAFPARAAAQDSVVDRMMPELRRLVSESGQMYVGPELLRAGRRVALVCGILTSLLVLVLGTSIAGAATGLLASQLLLLHPGVIGAYRHAMSDAPAFMLGTAAVLATWLLVKRHTGPLTSHSERLSSHPERSEGSAVLRAALVGALIGLAVSAKLNWVIVAFLFAAVWAFLGAQAWRRNDRSRALRAVAIGVVGLATSLAVFIVIDPPTLIDPIHNLMTPVRELRLAARIQAAVLANPPFLATVSARVSALSSLVLWTPWAFALAVAAVAFACVKAPRSGIRFVAAWWVIAFVAVSAWIPFEWARYALPLTIPSVLLGAYAVVVALSALARRPAT
jgi:hypothetical protein